MASMDSIGNCSLDVDASCYEAAIKCSDTVDPSENTLRSMSLDDLDDPRRTNGMDPFKERSNSGHALRISNEPNDIVDTFVDGKKPSYLNISCSISGYSDYSHYHHSRPNISTSYLSRSRDSSPMPGSKMLSTLNYNIGTYSETTKMRLSTDEPDFINTKEYISETNDKKYFMSKHEFSVVSELKKATVHSNSRCDTYKSRDVNGDSETKSIVKQRIERLTAHRISEDSKHLDKTNISQPSISKGSPPVFRHLRKEFRDQLNVASKPTRRKESSKSLSPVRDHQSSMSSLAHSPINGHSAHKHTDPTSKPNPPRKPEGLVPMSSKLLLEMSSKSDSNETEEPKRDGHYFLNVMANTKEKIHELLVQPLKELDDAKIPEDAKGKIRSAIGKANLLTSKKFSQFRELCEKNINQSTEEQFSTNSSDLEGFWDMVMLQVTDIYDTFAAIDKMRNNSWKEEVQSKSNGVNKGKKEKMLRGQSKSAPTTPERSAKAAAAAKAREEARKRLMAAKKKGRQANSQNSQNVEIYAP